MSFINSIYTIERLTNTKLLPEVENGFICRRYIRPFRKAA